MRKYLLLICVLFLCTLTGCKSKATKEVEQLISAIGTVTIESSGAIEKAEQAFNSLSIKEQQDVKNYNSLLLAKEALKALPIELTLDNYEKYLKVSTYCNDACALEDSFSMNGIILPAYVNFSLNVEPASPNFLYNDVVVVASYKGKVYNVYTDNDVSFSEELTVNCDIGGEGKEYSKKRVGPYVDLNSTVEIISINGTVEKN